MLFNVTPTCRANLATTTTTTTPSTFLSSIVASLDLVHHILPLLVDHVSPIHWCHFPFTKGLGCLQCLPQKMHCFRVPQMHSPEPASCLLQPKSQAPGWRPYIYPTYSYLGLRMASNTVRVAVGLCLCTTSYHPHACLPPTWSWTDSPSGL